MPDDRPPLILNVEDNEAARYAKTRLFRQAGFEVIEAANGTDALRLAASRRPHILVCDVNLPDISGPEVCERIKGDRDPAIASILVLHLTASAVEVSKRVAGLQAGADSYLVEPIDPSELIATVRALLRLQAAEASARAVAAEAERRRQEAEAARKEAESANRAKDEFLATVSHELRTPLDAILGWTQILRSRPPDEATLARALETIERNAWLQAKLVGDILDASRIITGKLRLEMRPVDLVSVVRAALDVVRPAAQAKALRFRAHLDPGAAPVSGDPARLQQVVWNLLSNAIKFTPRHGQVHITLERVSSQSCLTVRDTGQGISADFLPYVFDRFRQAETGTTRSHGGLGLGLAIVRHLVELHGGEVTVRSPGVDQGATFTVRLPLLAVTAVAGEGSHAPPGASGMPPLDGVRVLVVDDEADARSMLTVILGQRGAAVTSAASVGEALTVLERTQMDVLVSDLAMPGEDGYALIRKVRALGPERGGSVPAIALTAHVAVEDRTRVLIAGYQTHVGKPVEASELVAVVATLAGRTGPGPT